MNNTIKNKIEKKIKSTMNKAKNTTHINKLCNKDK